MEEIIKETINNEKNTSIEGTIEDILKDATQSKSKSKSKAAGEAGVLSIINAETGVRLVFAKTVSKALGFPEKIQISYDKYKKNIIVGEHLMDNENSYSLRKSGNKSIVYSKRLVEEITEAMELDFSDRTSITFQEVEYQNDEHYSVAIIEIK